MAIRKDANTLTSAERTEFVNAVLELKNAGIYDQFVLRHANAIGSAIHRAPAFLPWHRRFILDFEKELQRVSGNPDLGLPYWNWPQGGGTASMWENSLLGGDGDPVTGVLGSGPFREGQWQIVNSSGSPSGPLIHTFGQVPQARSLPTQQEIDQVLAVTPYDRAPWNVSSNPSFRNELEGFRGPNLHNRGHIWVGGSMMAMTSPNDPVFFMHHCMVDKVWHEWQLRFPSQGYLPVSGGPFGQNLTDPMDSTASTPIGPRPIDVLDSAALGISYDRLMSGTPDPDTGNPAGEVELDGDPVNGEISTPGEIDQFSFEVPAFTAVTVETSGSSDTFMTLFGPDDPTLEVASDDDGGMELNARISRTLSAGSYFVTVRLFDASRTGVYSIQARTESGSAIPELPVNGPEVSASISAQQESDLFRFEVVDQGVYTIETGGSTDTFLTLLGPDSQTTEIARDDDSGVSTNARIQQTLTPGAYFARVRHFSRFGTGGYTIRVNTA